MMLDGVDEDLNNLRTPSEHVIAMRRMMIWYSLLISLLHLNWYDDPRWRVWPKREPIHLSLRAGHCVFMTTIEAFVWSVTTHHINSIASMIKYKLPLPNPFEEMLNFRNQYVTYEKHYRNDDEHIHLIWSFLKIGYAAFLLSGFIFDSFTILSVEHWISISSSL